MNGRGPAAEAGFPRAPFGVIGACHCGAGKLVSSFAPALVKTSLPHLDQNARAGPEPTTCPLAIRRAEKLARSPRGRPAGCLPTSEPGAM